MSSNVNLERLLFHLTLLFRKIAFHLALSKLDEYDSMDALNVVGLKSSQIEEFLGPNIRSTMIHRDDMVLSR